MNCSTMATPKNTNTDEVEDSDLLYDNDDTLVIHTIYDHNFESTPTSSGKNLRISSPHPSTIPKTPPQTPPRPMTSTQPSTASQVKINIPTGPHQTRLGIYLHTDRRPSLTKIITTQHACNPQFYSKPDDLRQIITRARHILMNQEPYFTMMNEGHSFDFIRPQLSYKVYAIDENELIDFVADLDLKCSSNSQNPVPFYEFADGRNYTQTDVSFLFRMPPIKDDLKPETCEKGTATYDAISLTPIIDIIRQAAPALQATFQQNFTSTAAPPSKPTLSLTSSAPPRHITTTTPAPPGTASRSRPHDRLGPPVAHEFRARSRSHERYRSHDRSRSNDRNRRPREFKRRK